MEILRSIVQAIEKRNQVFFHTLLGRHPGEALSDYIGEHGIQFLAVAKQQFHAVGRHLNQQLLEDICALHKIPFLILKAHNPISA